MRYIHIHGCYSTEKHCTYRAERLTNTSIRSPQVPVPSWARTLRELNVRDGRSKKAQVVRDSAMPGDGGWMIGGWWDGGMVGW